MNRKTAIFLWILLVATQTQDLLAACPTGLPTCNVSNPRYFDAGDGKALYLTGSHIWHNFQDWGTTNPPPALDYPGFLDFLEDNGHNFMRGWTWEHARWIPWSANSEPSSLYIAPLPFLRNCPKTAGNALDGGPKFNLDSWNQEFFDDLSDRVAAADASGIHVSVMLFQGWSFKRPSLPGDPWQGHPLHHLNNCNGIDGDPPTGTPATRTGTGHRVHSLQLPEITTLQKSFIVKMIETLNDFDNIIWEITNESDFDIAPPGAPIRLGSENVPSSVTWQHAMIDFIKAHETANAGKQHLVWMTGTTRLSNSHLTASNADVISPGGNIYKDPPIASGSKIQILDTDHIWGLGGDRIWVWKSFTRGYHPIFMDPDFGLPLFTDLIEPIAAERQRIRNAMGDTLSYARRMDLAAMTPRGQEICSTGHCLVNEGQEYLIFQSLHSSHGDNSFTVSLPDGEYRFEHFNPYNSTVVSTSTLTVQGGSALFDLPNRPVVYLERISPPPPPLTVSTPQNVTVTAGAGATFSVTAGGGSTPYQYRWFFSSTSQTTGFTQLTNSQSNISGAPLPTLVVAPTNEADEGWYKVRVRDADYATQGTEIFSQPARLTVNTGASPVCSGLLQEAEQGALGGRFVIGNNPLASGGSFVHVPQGSTSAHGQPGGPDKASFCFHVPIAGNYRLQARHFVPDSNSDSFYVALGSPAQETFNWVPRPFNQWVWDDINNYGIEDPIERHFTAGDHLIDVFLREDGAILDALELKPVGIACPDLTQEAEHGQLSGRFQVVADAAASGGQYVHVPEGTAAGLWPAGGADRVRMCLRVPVGGSYRLQGRQFSPGFTSDSFWVQLDGQPAEVYNWLPRPLAQWATDAVNNHPVEDPIDRTLSAGSHFIDVFLREDGTRLDSITLQQQ